MKNKLIILLFILFGFIFNHTCAFGDNIEEGDDDEEMKIRGFYTWHGAIILTDGCGDGDLDDILSDEEARKFISYISDENNLKFEI